MSEQTRQQEGRETWVRLLEWQGGSAAAERLAGLILRAEGFTDIDPSHPLGGPDGLKDLICKRDDHIFVCAAHFPRGRHDANSITAKFAADLAGCSKNNAIGFAFITNQELTLSERQSLNALATAQGVLSEIYHLERLSSILNSPPYYGVRLEFLGIEMTKDEQLSFFASRDSTLQLLNENMRNWFGWGFMSALHPSFMRKRTVLSSEPTHCFALTLIGIIIPLLLTQ